MPKFGIFICLILSFINKQKRKGSYFLLVCLIGLAVSQDYSVQNQWGGECQTGQKQSPINIKTRKASHCQPHFSFELKSTNANYTQIAYDHHNQNLKTPFNLSKIVITTGGTQKVFTAIQFHFHHKSEHHFDGKEFDIELHVVHQAADQSLAVYGVLFRAQNGNFQDPFDNWHLNTTTPINQPFPIDLITPDKVFHYKGSLTTPDCNQGVEWFVNEKIFKIKQSNLHILAQLINEGKLKNRNIQKTNRRKVTESGEVCAVHKGIFQELNPINHIPHHLLRYGQ